jgi:hypothetical protein
MNRRDRYQGWLTGIPGALADENIRDERLSTLIFML